MPYKTTKMPVKLISLAWDPTTRLEKVASSTRPVCATQMASRKMRRPLKTCHGSAFSLVVLCRPGYQNTTKPNNHCMIHTTQNRTRMISSEFKVYVFGFRPVHVRIKIELSLGFSTQIISSLNRVCTNLIYINI